MAEPDADTSGEEAEAKKPFNYVAVVGVVFFLIIAAALFNMLKTEDSGTVGLGPVLLGERVPEFAVPIATSDLDGDANIDEDQACSVEGDDVMRICDYFDRPLVMSFWYTKGSDRCVEQQDTYEDLATRFAGRAEFISINVRDDRDRVKELIEENGWQVPVGYDRDGAVSNIYRVGVCPTFLFVRPGGILENAEVGTKTLDELDAQVRSLLNSNGKEIEPDQAGT